MKYDELVKALRETATFTKFDDLLSKREQKLESLAFDAAAAIEELQAQLPKRGEWKVDMSHFSPHIVCSVCGVEIPCVAGWCMDAHMNYCPNCGAKMEVQDGE